MKDRSLAIIGLGKMGRAIQHLAPEAGWEVRAALGSTTHVNRKSLNGASVALEFTEPGAAVGNIRACVAAGCPVVVGTTGWYGELPAVEKVVADAGGAMLWAPNFSLGVNVLTELVRAAGVLLAGAENFDAHIVETHHKGKKDAPSGTASQLRDTLVGALHRTVSVTSVRTGAVPGTHEVMFDAPFEQIALRHEARDRRVFASGALTAAAWIIGKRGVFTMRDVLGGSL